MLCRTPTKVSATLENRPGCAKADMGVTTPPEGGQPPQLALTIFSEGPSAWKVRCRLTPAVEATNESIYLGAGTYAIGLGWGDWFSRRGRVYRRIIRSATFSVGVTTSQQLIHL